MKKNAIRIVLGLVLILAVSWAQSGQLTPVKEKNSVSAARTAPSVLPETESHAVFLAVGDIMLSRGVNRAIDRSGDQLLPFSRLTELFDAADFSFGNFESPISGNDNREGKGLVFNTHRPDVEGMTRYKFKIVALANNHALDQGIAGLAYTRRYLTDQGIQYIGVGENKDAAWRGKVVEASGIRIGFVGASYSSYNDGGANRNNYVARIEERHHLRDSIDRLKAECDIVIVAMHAGVEYTRRPHRSQVEFARAAIDSGADMVIGSHPHWIQTIEHYKGKVIFYSLGNFIFDQRQPGTREGLMLRVSVRRSHLDDPNAMQVYLDRIELIPVVIEHVGVPRRATETETAKILAKIGVSEPLISLPR